MANYSVPKDWMMVGGDAQDIVINFLNHLVETDREAMHRLVEHRVDCNADMAEHPTVQVHGSSGGPWQVGLLGVLNGLIDADSKQGLICAMFDGDDGKLVRFGRHYPGGEQ